MKKRVYIYSITGAVCVLVITGVFVFFSSSFFDQSKEVSTKAEVPHTGVLENNIQQTGSKNYQTVSPVLLSNDTSRLLVGQVVSNEVATIYPRRNGIIKDIYADIGDQVKEGNLLALLLPPGVEGESSAAILEKDVALKEAKKSLLLAKKSRDQAISSAKLNVKFSNYSIDNTTPRSQRIKEVRTQITNYEEVLGQLKKTQKQERDNAYDDMMQLYGKILSMVEDMLQTAQHVMVLDDYSSNSYDITNDVSIYFSAKNTVIKNELVKNYGILNRQLQTFSTSTILSGQSDAILVLISDTIDFAGMLVDGLEASVSSQKLLRDTIENNISLVLNKQQKLIDVQSQFKDKKNAYLALLEKQKDQLVLIQSRIENARAMLQTYIVDSFANNQQTEAKLELIREQQNLLVQKHENAVAVAQSQLQQAYAKYGNTNITSSFDGTVSKRMVDVGDVVTTSTPLFELVDVPTALSYHAKKEIQFGLPEEFIGSLSIGDVVHFSQPADETTLISGTVTRMSPQIDSKTNTLLVKAKVPDTYAIAHNTRVNVWIPLDEHVRFRVPSSTIKKNGTIPYIDVLTTGDMSVEKKIVTVLAEDGEYSDIQADITTGSLIINE